MKLRQLRYIWEVAHHELNVSATAQSLYTSQPGISKQIRLLEDELGVEVFARSGKHLTHITPAGKKIIETAGQILNKVDSIKQMAQEFSSEDKGSLSIATTHTQARYMLPNIIKGFMRSYPEVDIKIQQGSPTQISQMAAESDVDFVISTETTDVSNDLVMLPCYQWNRCVLAPKGHPLTYVSEVTLHDIAKYSIVTYVSGVSGRSKLDEAFWDVGIDPKIVFTATDTDVIKTYVRLGLGVGIVAKQSYEHETDSDLVCLNTSHLFEPSITSIGFRRGTFLRGFMYNFISLVAPHLTKEIIDKVMACSNKSEREEFFKDTSLPLL